MDLSKVLDQLRRELAHVDAAILSLERLQTKAMQRGRPPRALLELRRVQSALRPPGRQTRRGPTTK